MRKIRGRVNELENKDTTIERVFFPQVGLIHICFSDTITNSTLFLSFLKCPNLDKNYIFTPPTVIYL